MRVRRHLDRRLPKTDLYIAGHAKVHYLTPFPAYSDKDNIDKSQIMNNLFALTYSDVSNGWCYFTDNLQVKQCKVRLSQRADLFVQFVLYVHWT